MRLMCFSVICIAVWVLIAPGYYLKELDTYLHKGPMLTFI